MFLRQGIARGWHPGYRIAISAVEQDQEVRSIRVHPMPVSDAP